jgi:zinc transport system permease protein
MEPVPGFFENSFLWREPLLVAVLAAVLCAFVGVFIVLRRMVFVSAALSQISGVGVASAFFLAPLLGHDPHAPPWYAHPVVLAALFAALAAAALLSAQLSRRRLQTETMIAIGYLIAAASVIVILNSPHVSEEAHEVNDLLYGNAVAVPPGALLLMAGTCAVVLGFHLVFHKDLLFVSFDGEMARTLGYRTWLWDLLLFETFAIASSVATRSIGALPVFGLMILPAAAALLLARRMWQVFALAVTLSVLATTVGYFLSWELSIPTGASIVVVAGATLLPGLILLVARR